jgi:hypothetical protein
MVKVDGSYTVPQGVLKNLTVGASFHWFSGLPLNAYGYSATYQNWEYYLVPRGSLGRGPADWEGDMHFGYPIKAASGVRANLVFDIFNVFNRQAINQLYQDYNEAADGGCAGIPLSACNDPHNVFGESGLAHIPGTITPVAQLVNPRATATSPDFLKAGWGFTGPRSARVGVRLTF